MTCLLSAVSRLKYVDRVEIEWPFSDDPHVLGDGGISWSFDEKARRLKIDPPDYSRFREGDKVSYTVHRGDCALWKKFEFFRADASLPGQFELIVGSTYLIGFGTAMGIIGQWEESKRVSKGGFAIAALGGIGFLNGLNRLRSTWIHECHRHEP
jgi:hypothetical protein